MMRFDGAFMRGGFSTISVMPNSLPFFSPTPTTPYMCTRSCGTSSTAITFACAPHGVAQAQRLLLPGEARGAGPGEILGQQFEVGALLAFAQRHLEFELAVEMILDDALVAPGHEDEVLDAGLARLIHHVLDYRPVDDRQHFLRHRLGCRQEPGAEASDGEDGLANRFHAIAAIVSRAEFKGI